MKSFTKDPNAVLDYQWNWSSWLGDGEVITDALVTVPDGITLDNTVRANETVTAWLSGGTVGTDYILTCKITTSASRTDYRSITIMCRTR